MAVRCSMVEPQNLGKVITMKKVMAALALVMMVSGTALAHSGGTDANGCHAGKKPYHCH
ncbi:YHYH domain-containing protein [Alcanivorax sp. P2S70]